jgi:hypothetical protein
MEMLVSILSSAAVSAGLAAALIFLSKSWITERLKSAIKSEYDLKLENYKHKLAAESAREIESLKAQLQVVTSKHQIQFSSLHEKLAETVAGVYSRVVELKRSIANYVKIMESDSDGTKEDRRKVVGKCFQEFHDFYQPNKIYMPKRVIPKIDELEEMLFTTTNEFMWKVEIADKKRGDGDVAIWSKCAKDISESVPPVLESLEDEFRTLLGHESPAD